MHLSNCRVGAAELNEPSRKSLLETAISRPDLRKGAEVGLDHHIEILPGILQAQARWQSTVAEQKAHNAHLKGRDETTFVRFRIKRDRALPLPDLMPAALQVNIAGGRLPEPQTDGRRYLKIPLNAFR